MPTWSGWQNQFLNAASLPTTAANRDFLTAWADHAGTNCGDNPIDLSHHETGSSNCHTLTPSLTAQKYASHASAARAFRDQLSDVTFNPLFFGFTNSTLDTTNASDAVINNVREWGSTLFGNYLFNQRSGSGGPGKGISVPHAHKGWADLRHSVNVKLPANLRQSQKVRENALRQLAQVRKVLR